VTMDPSLCERCAGPIDGPAYRIGRVNRCLACARICRSCDRAPAEHPFLKCRPCWPRCERCGSELPSKGSKTARVRCAVCVDLCRQCEAPLDRSSDARRQMRLCPPCGGSCPQCGKQSVGLGQGGKPRRCSSCVNVRRRATDAAAKLALGGRCARCGIADLVQWDHVNDDPRRTTRFKRPSVGQSEKAELRAIVLTGRSDRLQLLCPNCNMLKQLDRARFLLPPTWGPLPTARM
jgi:hypothetical protein